MDKLEPALGCLRLFIAVRKTRDARAESRMYMYNSYYTDCCALKIVLSPVAGPHFEIPTLMSILCIAGAVTVFTTVLITSAIGQGISHCD